MVISSLPVVTVSDLGDGFSIPHLRRLPRKPRPRLRRGYGDKACVPLRESQFLINKAPCRLRISRISSWIQFRS